MSNCRTIDFGRLARVFGALSNPKRLRLLQRLVEGCCSGTGCCTSEDLTLCIDQLAEELGLAKSTVSHHVKELREAGLIGVERRGKFNDFRIEGGALVALTGFLEQLLGSTGSHSPQDQEKGR